MSLPECFFDAAGSFTLGECKWLGWGVESWIALFGFVFGVSVIAIIGFIWRRVIKAAGTKLLQLLRAFYRSKNRASGKLFAILVAQLEGDGQNHLHQKSVIDAIEKELPTAEVIVLPQVISVHDDQYQQAKLETFQKVQDLLRRHSCDLAIWGRVKADDVISIRFSVFEFGSRVPESYKLTDTLELPTKFIATMTTAIAARAYVADSVSFIGPDYPERMRNFAKRLERLLEDPRGAFGPDVRATLLVSLAETLNSVGSYGGEQADVLQGIRYYREALKIFTSRERPTQWESVSFSLAAALFHLGQRSGQQSFLEESEKILRGLIAATSPRSDLIKWLTITTQLILVLHRLGESSGGPVKLKDAEGIGNEALKQCTREELPYLWAAVASSLASVLVGLAEHETVSNRSLLNAAINLYRQVLEIWADKRAPYLWSGVETLLSNAYRILGERQKDIPALKEAIRHARLALKRIERSENVEQWVQAHNNQAIALLALGEIKRSPRRVRRAIRELSYVDEVTDAKEDQAHWLMLRINQGHALTTLGALTGSAAPIQRAIRLIDSALLIVSPMDMPLHSAMLANNIGVAHITLGHQIGLLESFEQAYRAHRSALIIYTHFDQKYYIVKTRQHLLMCVTLLGGNASSKSSSESWFALMDAIVSLNQENATEFAAGMQKLSDVLYGQSAELDRSWSALGNYHLGHARRQLAERTGAKAELRAAETNLLEAARLWADIGHSFACARAEHELGNIYLRLAELTNDRKTANDAIMVLSRALAKRRRIIVRPLWADTAISLGSSFALLASQEMGPRKWLWIGRAIRLFSRASSSFEANEAPSIWALANNNLASTYMELYQFIGAFWGVLFGNVVLRRAEKGYVNALTKYSRERAPNDWAMAKMNLGNVFLAKGERQHDSLELRKSIAVSKEAMEVYTRQSAPYAWAMCNYNCGLALKQLGDLEDDATILHDAASAFRSARRVLRRLGNHEQQLSRLATYLSETVARLQQIKRSERRSAENSFVSRG